MKLRLIYGLAVVLALNLSLIAASAFLSVRSTQHHPMLGQHVTVHGVRMHVVDSGLPKTDTGQSTDAVPTLVLIHGASTSLLDFEPSLKPLLRDTARIISIDRPGHGYSERGHSEELALLGSENTAESYPHQTSWINPQIQARLISDVLRKMRVEKSIWIGHSWAGSVVLAALLDNAAEVTAGVLIAGATHPWEGGSSWHAEVAAKPLIGPLFSWQYIQPVGRLALRSAIESVFAPEQVPDNYIENTGVVLSLRPETFQHNAQDLTQLSRFLKVQSTQYERIEAPVLSITGSEDTVVPGWTHDARLAQQMPQLTSRELSGAGHAPHHTRADEVADIIQSFVHSVKPASATQ